jgi:hypothetical protein
MDGQVRIATRDAEALAGTQAGEGPVEQQMPAGVEPQGSEVELRVGSRQQ